MKNLTIVLTMLVFFQVCQAEIVNVPENFETIQAGVDAAADGDTVLVQPGVYEENIVVDDKTVFIASMILLTDDPVYIESTIIDGQRQASTVACVNCGVNIRGFTIHNGNSDADGGGIMAMGNSVIEDVRITNNEAAGDGGGAYIE